MLQLKLDGIRALANAKPVNTFEFNKLYNENCIETMARMPANIIDLTVTSPPYDNLRTYMGKVTWNFEVFKLIAKGLWKVTKPGGVIVWIVNDQTINGSETGNSFRQALYFKEIGFNLHDTMIYAKINPIPLNHNRYDPAFEYCFIFSKGTPKVFNPIKESCKTAGKAKDRRFEYKAIGEKNHGMKYSHKVTKTKEEKMLSNIWLYTVGVDWNIGSCNNAPFPEQLANDHIITWSNEGDIVFDPMAGSGTTIKIAILNKRKWVASEIVPEYCADIEMRIKGL